MLIRAILCATLLLGVAPRAFAQLSASNGQTTLTVLAPTRVRGAPGEILTDAFSVRVADASGRALSGVVIDIFPNFCIPLPLLLDSCPLDGTYGLFDDTAFDGTITTGADGVASSPPFRAGLAPGIYDVAAGIFPSLHEQDMHLGTSINVTIPVLQTTITDTVAIGPGFTGAWYDPAQSGHGLVLEVLSDQRLLAYWFTFTPAGLPSDGPAQAWFGGVGTFDAAGFAIVQADIGSGGAWIPNFDPSQFRLNSWGTLMFGFSDCNHGRVEFAGVTATPDGTFGSGSMDLVRLTQPAGLSCP